MSASRASKPARRAPTRRIPRAAAPPSVPVVPAKPVVVRNRQRDRSIVTVALADIARQVVGRLGRTAELCIHLVSAREMARVNWDFLRHEGSTDVITFDHASGPAHLHGELFVSVADAVRQADEFGTRWPEEVVRYAIHGILHLCGHDDLEPGARRAMKREENRLVRWIEGIRPASDIEGVPKAGVGSRKRHG